MSVSAVRRRIYSMVLQERCDQTIFELLLPNLSPIEHEDALWDFKQALTLDPTIHKNDPDYAGNCCELVKDIAAFHNTFGGYIIIGVDDKTKSISDYTSNLDIDLVNARIRADLNASVDFTYRRISFHNRHLGLIFIPRRRDGIPPIQFRREAKPKQSGRKSYKNGDIYYRDDAASAPAI